MICASFPGMQCGIADYTAQLINSLKGLGINIGIITSYNEKIIQHTKSSRDNGITVFPIIKDWSFRNLSILLKKVSDFNPDVIHIQYQWWMYHGKAMITLLPLLLKFLKKDFFVITTFHDLMGPYLFPKAGPLRKLGVLTLAAFSDKIITTNKKDTENLIRLAPWASGKISYIPTGAGIFLDGAQTIDGSRFRGELRDSENQTLISNFGYMLPFKGLEVLLEAIKILIDKKYRIKLLAIGGFNIDAKIDSSYFLEIQEKANTLKIAPYVKWLGYCSPQDVSSYLKSSDICVLPYTDGVSERRTSFISALSHGLPIITTKHKNCPERLIEHHNVLLVEPENPNKLADAMEELINSLCLREKLAKGARRLYEEEYAWDIITAKTLKVYNDRKIIGKVV